MIKLKADLTPLAVCKIEAEHATNAIEQALEACAQSGFSTISQTESELSIVCEVEHIQSSWQVEKVWNRLEVQGPLEFSMVGVLSELSDVLAQNSISIFVVSTFDTDHILVKDSQIAAAIVALKSAGYTFV